MNDIFKDYFDWLVGLVDTDHEHSKLYKLLDEITFRFSMEMDSNRYEDGMCMRYEYIYEKHLPEDLYDAMLVRPCSVLEMMVALAYRCEQHIMSNSDFGNRTTEWFQYMVKSLGLWKQTDSRFNEEHCKNVIEKFLDRDYLDTGTGGLFHISDARKKDIDMRKLEIWDQAMLYLNTILF